MSGQVLIIMTSALDTLLDGTDRALILRLRDDARASVADLARSLGLSRTTVQSRLERLERSGLIVGYTVRLSDAYERGLIHAYVMITVHPKQAGVVAHEMRKMAGVRRLQSVSGPADMIAFVAAPDAAEMDALIDAIGALEGVERTTSSIVLATKVDR
jgi:DNA-binding Lrp family transcriptional regulator